MTRDIAREIAVQAVFGAAHSDYDPLAFLDSFFSEEHYSSLAEENELFAEIPDTKYYAYISGIVSKVFENLAEIDGYIQKYSHSWSVNRISGTALAVLRVAICEILYIEDVPTGTAINSAVEIAKNYDEEATVSFINGVLGGFVRGETAAQNN